MVTVVSQLEFLTPSEIDALAHAIAPAFLMAEGWTEGDDSEVKNQAGRKIFRPGFGSAIRKVLQVARNAKDGKAGRTVGSF